LEFDSATIRPRITAMRRSITRMVSGGMTSAGSRLIAGGLCPVLVLALLSTPLRAQEPTKDLPWDRYGLFFGGFLARYDSTVRFGSQALGTGIAINLEDALGLDTTTNSFRFGGFWRTSDNLRHAISLDYFSAHRTASKTLDSDITIGDTTYPAGTT